METMTVLGRRQNNDDGDIVILFRSVKTADGPMWMIMGRINYEFWRLIGGRALRNSEKGYARIGIGPARSGKPVPHLGRIRNGRLRGHS